MTAKPKRTKYGALPTQGKTVPVSCWPTDEDSHNLVSWRVGEVELAGPWPWGGIDNAKAGQIHRFLSEMEKLVWGAASQNQARIKTIPLERISAQAVARLRETERDDVDDLVELHLSGRERIWGVRRGNVCHLLWWDPRHEVCPSTQKGT